MNTNRLRSRSRFLLWVSLGMFGVLLFSYGQLEFQWPGSPAAAPVEVRGRILTEDGTVLAQSLKDPQTGLYRRIYPQKTLAGALLGVMGTDRGLSGVELAYDDELRGGEDVVLTIDPWVQAVLEAQLDLRAREHQGVYGSAVMLDTVSGKVLAAVSWPPFDPNRWREFPQDRWRNRPFTDSYEPGSVIKALVVAAALNEGLTRPEQTYDTPMWRSIGRNRIRDAVQHPARLTTREVLRYSSNVGMSHIIEPFSREGMHRYFKQFGFGEDTGIENIYTEDGLLYPPGRWSEIQKVNMSFGQGMTTNTVQVAAAYNALANDGRYITPYLVKKDRVFSSREVVRPETARTMRELLRRVIVDGIPQAAGLEGYDLSGKSSTAQVVVNGRYSNEIYNSLFAGFFPSNLPKVTLVVMVNGAKVRYFGSMLAAPVFRDVAGELMSRWGWVPDFPQRQQQP